jgi:hypothetical protein
MRSIPKIPASRPTIGPIRLGEYRELYIEYGHGETLPPCAVPARLRAPGKREVRRSNCCGRAFPSGDRRFFAQGDKQDAERAKKGKGIMGETRLRYLFFLDSGYRERE